MSRPRHVRVVIVGAGSVVFTKTLIRDILAGPIRDVEFVLMDPSTRRTPLIQRWAEALIEAHGLPATVVVETDQAAAIAGSDYVFTTFQVGGLRATELDYEVPLSYGVDQCIGDTLAPAASSAPCAASRWRGRTSRATWRSCAPDAVLLNYANPMAMICWALGRLGDPVRRASATACRPRST